MWYVRAVFIFCSFYLIKIALMRFLPNIFSTWKYNYAMLRVECPKFFVATRHTISTSLFIAGAAEISFTSLAHVYTAKSQKQKNDQFYINIYGNAYKMHIKTYERQPKKRQCFCIDSEVMMNYYFFVVLLLSCSNFEIAYTVNQIVWRLRDLLPA